MFTCFAEREGKLVMVKKLIILALGVALIAGCNNGSTVTQFDTRVDAPVCNPSIAENRGETEGWVCVKPREKLRCFGDLDHGVCQGLGIYITVGDKACVNRRTGDFELCGDARIGCFGKVIVQGPATGNLKNHSNQARLMSKCLSPE